MTESTPRPRLIHAAQRTSRPPRLVVVFNGDPGYSRTARPHEPEYVPFQDRPAMFKDAIPSRGCSVKGFSLEIKQRQGVLITGKPRNAPEGTPSSAMVTDQYYEIALINDGSNPDWPIEETEGKSAGNQMWHIPVTALLKGKPESHLFHKGKHAVAPDSILTRVEATENFFPASSEKGTSIPAHWRLEVKVYRTHPELDGELCFTCASLSRLA